jgi:hypothetical protein
MRQGKTRGEHALRVRSPRWATSRNTTLWLPATPAGAATVRPHPRRSMSAHDSLRELRVNTHERAVKVLRWQLAWSVAWS